MSAIVVVPSLKISGGIREALRLGSDLTMHDNTACVLSMWVSSNEMSCNLPVKYLSSWSTLPLLALLQIPIIAKRFVKLCRPRLRRAGVFIFTHYTTLPLALLVPHQQRLFFVQDLEWKFVGNRLLSYLLRLFILKIYRSGRIISANSYLSGRLANEGIHVDLEAPIWAGADFLAADAPEQDVDCVMVLRKGDHKRLDLYLRFIALARAHRLIMAVITTEDDIAAQVRDHVYKVLLRPQHAQMCELYSRSICFIHLSEHEGFGLPPLESMGAGCTPICRDSGGVRAFMRDGPFSDLLLPLSMPIEEIVSRAVSVIRDPGRAIRRAKARAYFQMGLTQCEQARRSVMGKFLVEN